jgi:hypothetical protein
MDQVEVIKLRGCIEHAMYNAFTGERLNYEKKDNLLVTVGRAFVLGQLESVNINTALTISQLALGSSTIAPTTADSALGGEVTRKTIATFSTTGLTINPPSWQAQVSFATNEANTTLGEVGLFNSNSGGTMISHATFTSFVKATSNTYSISYTISG